jgi:hypothetical protein
MGGQLQFRAVDSTAPRRQSFGHRKNIGAGPMPSQREIAAHHEGATPLSHWPEAEARRDE